MRHTTTTRTTTQVPGRKNSILNRLKSGQTNEDSTSTVIEREQRLDVKESRSNSVIDSIEFNLNHTIYNIYLKNNIYIYIYIYICATATATK